ncbi:MAG TPA: TatD family hydrolase [Ginsengibacter sp.]|nr:TatD family hydrolase [Chitinophagaceae bacterium]HRN72838.1 TatD family hydrolase [Ginsengibacter sp.]HRP18171.1 TatD family hydrolase [Ginsengibacter sp.]HRP44049.1 TatD family hydrolase [Ginsengibacter sp.]
MVFIDTHTHLYTEEFNNDRKEIILSAIGQGLSQFYLPAIDSSTTQAMLDTKNLFPDQIFLMAGLHPCSVKENFKEELKHVESFMEQHDFKGIGETGLDFYWDTTYVKEQKESLYRHIEWAIQLKKPLILHTRNSTRETIDIVKPYISQGLTGIFHCFSGTAEEAAEVVDMGFFLGIGGVITFKNSGLHKAISGIDLSHIVLETDSPYLAPVPYRGKRNESGYIPLIAQKLAEVKEVELEEVARITTSNALNIYKSSLS